MYTFHAVSVANFLKSFAGHCFWNEAVLQSPKSMSFMDYRENRVVFPNLGFMLEILKMLPAMFLKDFIIIIIILDFEWRVWIKTHNFNCVYWKLEGHTPSTVVGIIKIRVSNILRVTNNWERLLVYEFPIQLMVWGCCKARPSSVSRALSWWTANADCIFLKERFYSTSAVKAFFYSFDKTVNFVFMVFKFSLRQKSFPVG